MQIRLFFLFFLFNILSVYAQNPSPKREFRAVWIATVINIDFPTSKNMPTEAQQKQFRDILNEHEKSGMNAVMVQIRPTADAFYESEKELWSEWLTGQAGTAPNPYYDPLEFMIREAHRRGMEFHAWLNPYRAYYGGQQAPMHPEHLVLRKPDWFVKYGTQTVFNPGLPEVRHHINEVVQDIVKRYDVDGIHFDDYFYPYQIKGVEFEDEKTFKKYAGGFQDKADWRRNNVNVLIETLHEQIKKNKPHVKFGVSPFGVWRNSDVDSLGSPTKATLACYDNVYADVRLWLAKGWIDYVSPQIYFNIGHKLVDYEKTALWWANNCFGKHLYIGQAPYRLDKLDSVWTKSEIPKQIVMNRQNPNILGSIYFSSKSLTKNYGNLQDSLRKKFYRYPALVPKMAWKDNISPNQPQNLEVYQVPKGMILMWEAPEKANDNEIASYYVVYRFDENEEINIENTSKILAIHREKKHIFVDKSATSGKNYAYAITAVDRLHNESTPISVRVIKKQENISVEDNISDWGEFLRLFLKLYFKHLED